MATQVAIQQQQQPQSTSAANTALASAARASAASVLPVILPNREADREADADAPEGGRLGKRKKAGSSKVSSSSSKVSSSTSPQKPKSMEESAHNWTEEMTKKMESTKKLKGIYYNAALQEFRLIVLRTLCKDEKGELSEAKLEEMALLKPGDPVGASFTDLADQITPKMNIDDEALRALYYFCVMEVTGHALKTGVHVAKAGGRITIQEKDVVQMYNILRSSGTFGPLLWALQEKYAPDQTNLYTKTFVKHYGHTLKELKALPGTEYFTGKEKYPHSTSEQSLMIPMFVFDPKSKNAHQINMEHKGAPLGIMLVSVPSLVANRVSTPSCRCQHGKVSCGACREAKDKRCDHDHCELGQNAPLDLVAGLQAAKVRMMVPAPPAFTRKMAVDAQEGKDGFQNPNAVDQSAPTLMPLYHVITLVAPNGRVVTSQVIYQALFEHIEGCESCKSSPIYNLTVLKNGQEAKESQSLQEAMQGKGVVQTHVVINRWILGAANSGHIDPGKITKKAMDSARKRKEVKALEPKRMSKTERKNATADEKDAYAKSLKKYQHALDAAVAEETKNIQGHLETNQMKHVAQLQTNPSLQPPATVLVTKRMKDEHTKKIKLMRVEQPLEEVVQESTNKAAAVMGARRNGKPESYLMRMVHRGNGEKVEEEEDVDEDEQPSHDNDNNEEEEEQEEEEEEEEEEVAAAEVKESKEAKESKEPVAQVQAQGQAAAPAAAAAASASSMSPEGLLRSALGSALAAPIPMAMAASAPQPQQGSAPQPQQGSAPQPAASQISMQSQPSVPSQPSQPSQESPVLPLAPVAAASAAAPAADLTQEQGQEIPEATQEGAKVPPTRATRAGQGKAARKSTRRKT